MPLLLSLRLQFSEAQDFRRRRWWKVTQVAHPGPLAWIEGIRLSFQPGDVLQLTPPMRVDVDQACSYVVLRGNKIVDQGAAMWRIEQPEGSPEL